MTNYMAIDLSQAKSGVCVLSVKDRKPSIKLAYLITSDKGALPHVRIDGTISEIKYVAMSVDAEVLVKEASIIRQVSTATPVIKTHAVFEHELADRFRIEDVSNSTVKAWARVVTGSPGKRSDKPMIAEAVEAYYGESAREMLYTPRGKLLDDVADAIALMTLWLEKEGVIETRFKREETKSKRKRRYDE